MKIAHLSFLSSIMIASLRADAQQENIHDLTWTVVAEIPAPPGVEKHAGLAGVCAGISNNALLIAGGANFPDGLPWQGGLKKYWDKIYVLQKKGTKFNWFQQDTFFLKKEIAYAASVTIPKGLVIIGGGSPSGLSKAVYL